MKFTVRNIKIKTLPGGYSIFLQGDCRSLEGIPVLRVNGQLHEASVFSQTLHQGRHPVRQHALRTFCSQMPDSLEIIMDGVMAWSSRPKDLKPDSILSWDLSVSPALKGWYVYGWCFYDDQMPVQVQVTEAGGQSVPVFRSSQPGVEKENLLSSLEPAFSFSVQDPEARLVFLWETGRQEIKLASYLKKAQARSQMQKVVQRFARTPSRPAAPAKAGAPGARGYHAWYVRQQPNALQLEAQRNTQFARMPRISILTALSSITPQVLERMVESLMEQSYTNWELCIVDGSENPEIARALERYKDHPQIHLRKLSRNLGQAANLNEALALACGDYIGFLEQGNFLARDALYEMIRALQEHPSELVYTDHDLFDHATQTYSSPCFKPDFCLDYLLSGNYIGSFVLVRSRLAKTLTGFRPQYEGAHMYDFLLRAVSEAEGIAHVARVLCHVDAKAASGAITGYEAGSRALQACLERHEFPGQVQMHGDPAFGFYDIQYHLPHKPMISVLSMTSDPEQLEALLESLRRDGYGRYEVISLNPAQKFASPAHFLNAALPQAKGPLVLFLASATRPAGFGCLEALASQCLIDGGGIVGGKLLWDRQTVKAAGAIMEKGRIVHAFEGLSVQDPGYMKRAAITSNCSVLPFDALMFLKADVVAMQGLAQDLKSCAAADFCLRHAGTPAFVAKALFLSPAPLDYDPADLQLFAARHPWVVQQDPCYNPGFQDQKEPFATRFA